MKTKKVVFIMGVGHSGSTLLDLILGSHSEAFSLGELWYVPFKLQSKENGLCTFCKSRCEFWEQADRMKILERYFQGATSRRKWISNPYMRYGSIRLNIYAQIMEWSGARILIDSSKKALWIRRQLRPFWHWKTIEPYLIFLSRDGRAVVNSYVRKYPERHISSISRMWVEKMAAMEKYFESFPEERRLKVSYEALVLETLNEVERICSALSIQFEPSMLEYWQHMHHPVNGNSGTYSGVERLRKGGTEHTEAAADKAFYQTITPGTEIRLDLRWRNELTLEQLEIFEKIAGKLNKQYAFDSQDK